jgi:hypothetical protein
MYGRDDEDFYDRLIATGYERREIPPAHLSFVEHTQQERLVNQVGPSPADPVEAFLRQPIYFEMYNLALTRLIPWGLWQTRARFSLGAGADGRVVFRRDLDREIPVAPPVHGMARLHGIRSVVAHACGLPASRVMAMDEKACLDALRLKLSAMPVAQRQRIPA